MSDCSTVVHYKIVFNNGKVLYPMFPASVDPYKVASDYALKNKLIVVSIEVLY